MEERSNFSAHLLSTRTREINFIEHRDYRESQVLRLVEHRKCLRLHSLRSIYHQEHALHGTECSRDFVGKINMPGSINEIKRIFLSLVLVADAHRLHLNRNATLLFKLHTVKYLVMHLPLLYSTGQL